MLTAQHLLGTKQGFVPVLGSDFPFHLQCPWCLDALRGSMHLTSHVHQSLGATAIIPESAVSHL